MHTLFVLHMALSQTMVQNLPSYVAAGLIGLAVSAVLLMQIIRSSRR